jgi:hypothetical protein
MSQLRTAVEAYISGESRDIWMPTLQTRGSALIRHRGGEAVKLAPSDLTRTN